MREPTVAELMTRQVISAVPHTPFKELVGCILAHDISALPVIDTTGRPIGVVAEADLLAKLEFHGGADQAPLLASSRCRARWRKASALIAADLMTTPALTIPPDTPVSTAAHLLADHQLRQLCIVDSAGFLIGVLTRRDPLRLFLRGDRAIHADVEHALAHATRTSRRIAVCVVDGTVTLSGALPLRSTVERAGALAQQVLGVIAVDNKLHYELDDLMFTGL